MFFLLPKSAETVGTEYLKDAEEDEETKTLVETAAGEFAIARRTVWGCDVFLKTLPVGIDKFAAQVVAIVG